MPRPNRVIGHLSPWVEYADELEAELETRELGFIQSLCELGQENAKLREALETIRDSGLEPIDPAYRRLATDALQEKGE